MTTTRCTESFTLANGEKVSCDRKAAPKHLVGHHSNVCLKCYEAWMMENDHNDYGHDEEGVVTLDCPLCGTYDPRTTKGHTNTAARTNTSHAACEHPTTPAARAKCRKARKQA